MTKVITMPDLPKALQKGLERKDDTWDNTVLHVSDLSVALGPEGTCPRSLWLRLKGAKKLPPTAGKLLMFDHGHRIHERVVEILEKGLPEKWQITGVEEPVRIEGITGTLDFMVWDQETDTLVIVDFKTQRGRAFGYLNGPKPSHVLQVQSYMAAEDVDHGLLFYLDREGQNASVQFEVERDDQKVGWAIEEAKRIQAAKEAPPLLSAYLDITENKGPDSVKLKEPWQCSYCDYRHVSCEGALPKDMCDNSGIIGYIDESGFTLYKTVKGERKRLCPKKVETLALSLYEGKRIGSKWMIEAPRKLAEEEIPF